MTIDDLTPQERRIAFLFELACSLLEQPKQLPPPEQNEKEDTYENQRPDPAGTDASDFVSTV